MTKILILKFSGSGQKQLDAEVVDDIAVTVTKTTVQNIDSVLILGSYQ